MKRTPISAGFMYAAFVVAPLMVLPGCFDGKKSANNTQASTYAVDANDTSKVLITLGGKSVITQKMLDEKFAELAKENPQFEAMKSLMPIEWNLLQALANDLVFGEYVKRQGVADSAEYQADKARLLKSVESMLNAKYFSQAYPVVIDDAAVVAFYNENKDTIPQLLISRGGFKTVGVKADTEAAAKELLAKVKESGDLNKAAQAAGLKDKIKDFHLVTAESKNVDAEVKKFVVGVTKFPTHALVKGDGATFWVVSVTKKEDSKYRELAEIKDQLKAYLEKQRESEEIQKRVEEFKKNYGIELKVDEAFFKPAAMQEESKAPVVPQAAQAQKPAQTTQVA